MTMTDPIADMLTRIRNANSRGKDVLEVPSSRIKLEIARILKEEAYIKDYALVEDGRQGMIRIHLHYGPKRARAIQSLKRISRPGCRIYVAAGEIPLILGGMGTAIITTPKGVLTDAQARHARVGGEVLCHIW